MAMDWGVELLRLSLFTVDTLSISDADWEAITGEKDAETRQLLPGAKRYIGGFASGQLMLAAVGPRIDVILSYLPAKQSETEDITLPTVMTLPIIGAWNEIREAYLRSTAKWLETGSLRIARIAFGAVLLGKTGDPRESYEALKSLLKSVSVDADEMRDFQYRVNWPARSHTVNGLMLNRLTTWSALQVSSLFLLQTGASFAASTGGASLDAVRLEIDNNTDQQHQNAFDQKDLVPIYKELVALACENAAKGERP